MKYSNHLLVIFGIAFSCHQVLAINHYKEFVPGRIDTEVSSQFYRSTSNYTNGGKHTDLNGGNYYQVLDSALGGRYGLMDTMNMYGNVHLGSAETKGDDATRTNSSITNYSLGGEYLWNMEDIQLIPEVNLLFAVEKISDTQDSAINSEGVNEYTGKLNLQMELQSFRLFGYAGFNYRDKGRSNLFPWGANAEWVGEKTTWGAEIFGFQSIGNDKDKGSTSEFNRDFLRAKVNAGSAKFYSINPSVVDTNAYMKLNISPRLSLWGAAGLTLIGANYANGYHAEAGLRFTFGGESSYEPPPRKTISVPVDSGSRLSTDKKVDQFKEDTDDGVDQRMFRPTPTPAPPKPKPKAKPALSDQQLKNKLDDAEMQIELRSNKKKKRR